MNSGPNHRIRAVDVQLVVVQDETQVCPYLDGKTARMPLSLPIGSVSPTFLDELLERGYRRSGEFVYRTRCPSCSQCEPTRVRVDQFQWTKSFRRVLRRGDQELHCRWGLPIADPERISLFNRHRRLRGLGADPSDVDAKAYQSFLVDSCCETRELSVYCHDRLMALAIFDVGERSLSAVYTHFDPSDRRYSLGTYSILKQIEWADRHDRRYCYLGMHVAENRHLRYKARFLPQRRIEGTWQDSDSAG